MHLTDPDEDPGEVMFRPEGVNVMTSFWSRRRALAECTRRVVVTGSLIAALLTAFAVLAGASFAGAHVTPAGALPRVTHPTGPVDTSPQPTPAGDQYGKPSGYKSKCTVKANAAYAAAVAKAKKALAAQLKLSATKAGKQLAVKKYNAALAAAKLKLKQNLKGC
jgi:hypothetical protein